MGHAQLCVPLMVLEIRKKKSSWKLTLSSVYLIKLHIQSISSLMRNRTHWINTRCWSMLIPTNEITTIYSKWLGKPHVIWVSWVLGLNQTWKIHDSTCWVNAWCRSMLISKDPIAKNDSNRPGKAEGVNPAIRVSLLEHLARNHRTCSINA